jgi:MSHA pilin protein MshC
MFVTPASRFASPTQTRGMTLVELVTAIVIIGVLGAAAIPRIIDNQSFLERGYVDEVASSLRYAQRIAVASGCGVRFTIDASGYSATQRNSIANCRTHTGTWSTQVMRGDGTALNGAPPLNVVASPAATLTFRDDGSLEASATPLSIGPFTLTIDQFSGTVTVGP